MSYNQYLPQQAPTQPPPQYLPFLSNQNKELVYEILQDFTKKKYRIMLSDIPDFVRMLEDTFVDVERTLGEQTDTTTKNKQSIVTLHKYINAWINHQTIPYENKSDTLNRNYEVAKQDFARYKPETHKPTLDLQSELDREAELLKEQYSEVNADDAYSQIMEQRQHEETQIKQIQLQTQNDEIALAWLKPSETNASASTNHIKLDRPSNIVNHDKPSLNIDTVRPKKMSRDVIKRHLPEKTVMFNNEVEVVEIGGGGAEICNNNTVIDGIKQPSVMLTSQGVNSASTLDAPDSNLWWNKNIQKPQLNITEKTLVTKNIHDNVISLNERFTKFKTVHINNIALPNLQMKMTNELDMDIYSRIADLMYIYVEIFVNGDQIKASSSQPKFMYRQDKEVGNYIYFTCNQVINGDTNPIITTIALRFYDEHEEPLNITPLIKMETLVNGTQVTNKINQNAKLKDPLVSYIKVAPGSGEFAPNDVIQIVDIKYSVMGVCKLNIRDADHINIEGLNQTKDYNTMIVQLNKEIPLNAKIMNLSRLPMVIVNVCGS